MNKIYNIFYVKIANLRKFYIVALISLFALNSEAIIPNEGFADIVEPLMPAVVNINTVKYNKVKEGQNRRLFPKDHFPPDHPFHEFFENFGMQFFGDEMPTNPKATSLGSGFIISADGEIVTNNHVIADADEISIKLNNNKEYKAKVIGCDPRTDLALLKIDANETFPFVKLGDSGKSRVGDFIIAIGNPFGLGGTVTSGIISSKSRDIDIISGGLIDDYIQTDAAINGGNSGGPMFNLNGEVIGVNTAILTPSGTNIGIGFAIPSNTVINIMNQLKTNGKIERGKLGIRIQEITPEIAEGLGLSNPEGVIVIEVDKGSAGEQAGLKPQDIITAYEDHAIKSVRKFQIMVSETPVNKKVKIKILRQGKPLSVTATVDSLKELAQTTNSEKNGNQGGGTSNSLEINGVTFGDIPTGKSNEEGVIVLSVDPKNKWRGFINKGDIVASLNQITIKNLDQFKLEYDKALKSGKKNIVFLIKRGQSTLYLALPLEQPK
ncbi:MAG: Do family serine endopeptidase [Rickettsiaceae bacterium]|nr:Do family serine endopeptidase [Rickettsiaceae bacterium]